MINKEKYNAIRNITIENEKTLKTKKTCTMIAVQL